jgi:hypothetical protein
MMSSPSVHVTKAALRARFGPDALITQFEAVWVVHVDQPSKAEMQDRLAELQQDLQETEDCACCDLMRPQPDDTVIFDGPMCLIEHAPGRKVFPEVDEDDSEENAASD